MKISTVLPLATLGLSAIGCSALIPDSGGYLCTADLRPAVIVEIRDAATNAPLALEASGVVREAAYTDSLRPAEGLTADPSTLYSRAAAHERPGVYSVEVKRPGYATFGVNDVRVDRDVCHVRTVRVQAALVALP
jgi:hypothetical protein